MRKQRTDQQNNSMHLYERMLAKALNEAGWETKRFLSAKPEIEIPWTKESIHELIWKIVLNAMTNKTSSTEMNTVDMNDVYLVVDRHISELTGVSVPWPTNEPPML
jgi:hypothetical protein